MNEHFTQENTDGYSDQEIAALNQELERRLDGINEHHPDYWKIVKAFQDEVAGR